MKCVSFFIVFALCFVEVLGAGESLFIKTWEHHDRGGLQGPAASGFRSAPNSVVYVSETKPLADCSEFSSIAQKLNGAQVLAAEIWFNKERIPAERQVLLNVNIKRFFSGLGIAIQDSKLRIGGRSVASDGFQSHTAHLSTRVGFAPGTWQHLIAVWDFAGGSIRGYLNGREVISKPVNFEMSQFTVSDQAASASIGAGRSADGFVDPFVGGIGLISVGTHRYHSTTAKARFESFGPPKGNAFPTFGKYDALKVEPDVIRPLAVGFGPRVSVWSDPYSNENLFVIGGHVKGFGTRSALFRQVGFEDGVPVLDSGMTLDVPGSGFEPVLASAERPAALSRAQGTEHGDSKFLYFDVQIADGTIRAEESHVVSFDNKGFKEQVGQSISGWHVTDLDQDGTSDLLVAALSENKFNYFPDGVHPWYGKEHPNVGKDRGYDVFGNWLGSPVTLTLYWAKGVGSGDAFQFRKPQPIYYKSLGYKAMIRDYSWSADPGVVSMNGTHYIVIFGGVDKITAMPFAFENGEIVCEKSLQVLEGESTYVRDVYFHGNVFQADIDADGTNEILIAGNPGRVTVLKGKALGQFNEVGSLLAKGGLVETDSLVSPSRGDWDGDGWPDLITGDASGYLQYWPGTKDPLVYGTPHFLKTPEGGTIVFKSDFGASIQGPSERRWGYLQPCIGDWDGNGKSVIIANNVESEMVLYRRLGSDLSLVEPSVFIYEEKHLPVAWRTRPDMLLPEEHRFADGLPRLLFMDAEGMLALATPEAKGSTEIKRVQRLQFDSGDFMKLDGPSGQWGRAKFCVGDWDGDGVWDILFGTGGFMHKHFLSGEYPSYATPIFIRNVGTPSEPIFAQPEPIRNADGGFIEMGAHNCSVWMTDLDLDGRPDLIAGAEDGRVYYFYNHALKTEKNSFAKVER